MGPESARLGLLSDDHLSPVSVNGDEGMGYTPPLSPSETDELKPRTYSTSTQHTEDGTVTTGFMVVLSLWWFGYTMLNITVPTMMLPKQFEHISCSEDASVSPTVSPASVDASNSTMAPSVAACSADGTASALVYGLTGITTLATPFIGLRPE